MKKGAHLPAAVALCAVALVLFAVPAYADHIDPASTAEGFLGIIGVAVAAAVGAFILIFKRKR